MYCIIKGLNQSPLWMIGFRRCHQLSLNNVFHWKIKWVLFVVIPARESSHTGSILFPKQPFWVSCRSWTHCFEKFFYILISTESHAAEKRIFTQKNWSMRGEEHMSKSEEWFLVKILSFCLNLKVFPPCRCSKWFKTTHRSF